MDLRRYNEKLKRAVEVIIRCSSADRHMCEINVLVRGAQKYRWVHVAGRLNIIMRQKLLLDFNSFDTI